MERKLASIQIISSLTPIPGADKILKATLEGLGWEFVVKKEEFKVGDMCIYVETDSAMPERLEFEFLRDVKFRVKVRKFKQQISQGLCFPLSILPKRKKAYEVGENVSEILGVQKYEREPEVTNEMNISKRSPFKKKVMKFLWNIIKFNPYLREKFQPYFFKYKINFPSFISKTDETRVQAVPRVLEEIINVPVYISKKMDGQSGTFYYKDKHFGVCSRSFELPEDDSTWWRVARKYNLKNKLIDVYEKEGVELAIQGEVCGPSIQANRMSLKDLELYVFQIRPLKGINEGKCLDFENFTYWANKLVLTTVPIINSNVILNGKSIQDLIDMANETKYDNGTPAEGIVIRPMIERYSEVMRGRLSFKIISTNFLLKYGE